MPSAFFALLDDVATITKRTISKTVPVLSDDVAVNAEQLSGGLRPERELPVIFKVFKGSLLNKVYVIIGALLLSAFMPSLIPYLLGCGAVYLLFEAGEAIFHELHHRHEIESDAEGLTKALSDERVDMLLFEDKKIKGALLTDLILSAEIIVIALGSLQQTPLMTQALVLSFVGFVMTVGVYGVVAFIVKMDDMGLALKRNADTTTSGRCKQWLGDALLRSAYWIMKFLPPIGVFAMILVGTDILEHIITTHHPELHVQEWTHGQFGWLFKTAAGVVIGYIMAFCASLFTKKEGSRHA